MKSFLTLCAMILFPLVVSGEEVPIRIDMDGPVQGAVTLELKEMWRAGEGPGEARQPIGDPSDNNIGVMISLGTGGGVLAATGGRLFFDTPTTSHTDRFLAISDAEGGDYRRILEKETPLDPTGRSWNEKADYCFDGRWDPGPDGLIYVPAHREECIVSVYDRGGKLLRSFGRDLALRKRTEAEKNNVGPIINVNEQRTDDEWKICDTGPSKTRAT